MAVRLHREALFTEYEDLAARGLLRAAKNLASLEVTPIRGEAARGRFTLPEVLAGHERVLVIGGQSEGKSTIVAHLALDADRRSHGEPSHLPFVVPVQLLEPRERLTVETLARLSPAAGAPLVERTLASRRALVIVDGVDQARGGPAALLESIPAFARAHAGNRFVVTTRPLPTGIPGYRRTELPDFLTTAILPPLPPSHVHPAYRFVGLRSPERKTALYLERVDALLAAWGHRALPPGATLGRLSLRHQRKLLGLVAEHLHQCYDFEIDVAGLTQVIAGALWCSNDGERLQVEIRSDRRPHRGLRPAPEHAPVIVAEIAAHPALLMERRPGRFAFADFVLQEVLAAVRYAQTYGLLSFVERRHDRWWHGVIELAAGLPKLDPAALVGALLDADHGEAPVVTVLAARCAEAAPQLPESTRRAIAQRFVSLVPPEHIFAAERLVEIGDIAAPAVLRALPGCKPTQRALSALVLGRLHHEPACGALVALATDTATIGGLVEWPVGADDIDLGGKPVATSALAALVSLAQVSRMGRKAFGRALERAPLDSVRQIHRHLERTTFDVWSGELDPERDPGLTAALLAQMEESLWRADRGGASRPR